MSTRPISPHLQIYKIQVTTFFSIMHRFTGVLLFFLLIASSWYFILYVHFPRLFIVDYFNVLFSSIVAKLIYILSFVTFSYHFFNGIRHLFWDIGINLEITSVTTSAIVLTLVLLLSSIAFLFMLI